MDTRGRPGPIVRVWSWVFVAGLVVATVVAAVLAATDSSGRSGAFVGLAVIWGAMAAASVAMLVAIERRRRRETGDD